MASGQVGTLHGYVCPPRRGQIKQDMASQLVLFVYLGQYWLFGIDHWLSLKPLFTD